MNKSLIDPGRIPVWFNNSGPDSDVVISSRIRLARNLENHRFPMHATINERKQIFTEISESIKSESRFRNFEILNFSNLQKIEQQYFVEERLVSPDVLNIEGERGVAFDLNRNYNIMINEEDHIRMQCLDSGFKPQELWESINSTDDILGRKLKFAFDQRRGFLTCCPTNSGTGMRLSFLLHLPGLVLTKAIDAVLQGASQMGISTRGFFGEHSEVVGNLFQLSNQATMGAHEQEFISSTKKIITDVIGHERTARNKILKEANLEISDKVYRAYGILLYAKTLSVMEVLNLTSALRMGISCNLFNLLTIEDLNRITLMSMPAHLQMLRGVQSDDSAISVLRAVLVKELLTKRKKEDHLTFRK